VKNKTKKEFLSSWAVLLGRILRLNGVQKLTAGQRRSLNQSDRDPHFLFCGGCSQPCIVERDTFSSLLFISAFECDVSDALGQHLHFRVRAFKGTSLKNLTIAIYTLFYTLKCKILQPFGVKV